MKKVLDQSDTQFLNEMHRLGAATVQDIGAALSVTATAIRQRLTRLQGLDFVSRQLVRTGRGRPHYLYSVTEKGLRQMGDNYGDLALILWREIFKFDDPMVRDALKTRVRDALVSRFGQMAGATVYEKLERLREMLVSHGYDVEIDSQGNLPILRENNCPYQELADQDRGICSLEQDVFQQVLGMDVKLKNCCQDGHHCCEFEVAGLSPETSSV